ncbi:unnamed protein product [Gordionus sp. m RMFG-2023]|uniref:6-phosphogluconolactonase-like n=1 Tax=Gordionus sp. m RMFG-2023 TaxID=3053472 RepID=UPI0030E2C751
MSKNKYRVYENDQELGKSLAEQIKCISDKSIAKNDQFMIGFSGGSLSKILCDYLPLIKTDWSKWKIFFCDERYVSENDPDNNYSFYKLHLLDKVPLKIGLNIFPINTYLPIDECAQEYANQIKNVTGQTLQFDLLLLGIGPDGHTCSLFPNHPQLNEKQLIVTSIINSPKPPPKRITMTFPLINNSCNIFVITTGDKKAEIIKKIFSDDQTEIIKYPIEMVESKNTSNIWFLDKVAASSIK